MSAAGDGPDEPADEPADEPPDELGTRATLVAAVEARRLEDAPAELARALNDLAVHDARLGRHAEALGAVEEAVRLQRALAAASPTASPGLATSLHNESNVLAALGRAAEALAALEEATALRRGLAAERPDEFTPALCASLSNLCVRLAAEGRAADALAASLEALDRVVPFLERDGSALLALGRPIVTNHLDRSREAGAKPDVLLVLRAMQALAR